MFRKNSIAIATQPASSEEVRRTATTFEVGQVNPEDSGLVWDGTRWIPRSDWEKRAIRDET